MKSITPSTAKAGLLGSLIAALSGLLVACGGGSLAGDPGSGGTGSYSSGPVSGFGSVILNNIRYNDSGARVETEDGDTSDEEKGSLSASDLKMGMIIEVEGGTITAATVTGGLASGTAQTIRYTNEFKGPVSAFSASSFTMLGQIIEVNAATVYEGLTGLDAATTGNCPYAEVYAYYNSDTAHYSATRIECLSAQPASYRLYGPVSNLQTSASTFTINGLTVSYSGLSAPSGLAEGATARVRLNNTWTTGATASATRLRITSKPVQTREHASIEGLITSFTSIQQFKVNGVSVATNSDTELETNTLGLGARVEVEGTMKNGILTAKSVEEKSDDDLETDEIEVVGTVSGATGNTGGTFTLTTGSGRVFTVTYDVGDFESSSDQTAFANGARAEVKGKLGSDGVSVEASEVELED